MEDSTSQVFELKISTLLKLKLLNKILVTEVGNIDDLSSLKNILAETLPFILYHRHSSAPKIQETVASALYYISREILKLNIVKHQLPEKLALLLDDCQSGLQKFAFSKDPIEAIIVACKTYDDLLLTQKILASFSFSPSHIPNASGISKIFSSISLSKQIMSEKAIQKIFNSKNFLILLKRFLSLETSFDALDLGSTQIMGLMLAYAQTQLPLSAAVNLKLLNLAILKTDHSADIYFDSFNATPGNVELDPSCTSPLILAPREISVQRIAELSEFKSAEGNAIEKEKLLIYLLKRNLMNCVCGPSKVCLIAHLHKLSANASAKNQLQLGFSLLALTHAIWSADVPVDTIIFAYLNFLQELIGFYQTDKAGKTWQEIKELALKNFLASADYSKSIYTDYEALDFLFDIYNLLREFYHLENDLPETNLNKFFSDEENFAILFTNVMPNPEEVALPGNSPKMAHKTKGTSNLLPKWFGQNKNNEIDPLLQACNISFGKEKQAS